jgi:alpha-tubulin suppressor-like RCC1 family protein
VALQPGVIAAGVQSTCALVGDGSVKCWGRNDFGQLGNGETAVTTPSVATRVAGLNQIVSLAAGYYHVCALAADGLVSCWGLGMNLGQDPASANSGTPLRVPHLDQVAMIAAGNDTTCALRRDATVWCWGRRQAAAMAGITDAASIAVGEESSCAVLANGSVKCWGWNGYGQLGDGTMLDALTPVLVVGVNDAAMLALGTPFSCALRNNLGVTCWGSEIPIGSPENVVALAALYENICFAQADGALQCFGQGGRVAVNDVGSVPGLDLGKLKGLTVGFAHGCVVAGDQETLGAWCWGPAMLLGEAGYAEPHVPVRVRNFP